MTVIVKAGDAGGSRRYHTDVCRVVWQIGEKEYWSREMAEAWDYTECRYCSGAFESEAGDGRQTRRELLDADGECRECGTPLGAGYICDECDTVEGWPDE